MPITIGRRPDHGFDEPLGLLTDCHRRIEYFLQVLLTIATQVNGGSLSAADRAQLDGALTYFATAAPRHTADEEESLFPRLRASDDPATSAALDVIRALERDHAAAQEHHAVVDALGRHWLVDGSLAPNEARQLRNRLETLQTIYHQHIAIEDRELFPAAGRVLSAEQLGDMGREMAARRVTRVAADDRAPSKP